MSVKSHSIQNMKKGISLPLIIFDVRSEPLIVFLMEIKRLCCVILGLLIFISTLYFDHRIHFLDVDPVVLQVL